MAEFMSYTAHDLDASYRMIDATHADLCHAVMILEGCKKQLEVAKVQSHPEKDFIPALRISLQMYTRDYERAMNMLASCASIRTWVMADSLGLDPGAVGLGIE